MTAVLKPASGINCLLKVNTGTDVAPTYTKIGGQRNASLKLNGKDIDTTSKDGAGWEENIPGTLSWNMDCDGLYIEDDVAMQKLESSFIARQQIKVELAMPGGTTYDGLATITALEYNGPQDKEMTANVSLKGSGALTPTNPA